MKSEQKLGALVLVSIFCIIGFAYFMGGLDVFSSQRELNLMFNYAGGLDEGSPVRVMGIKVGKVKKITFDPGFKMPNGEEVKLRVQIGLDKKAWDSVRKDSKFFINLAGVIGEKFLEITPGSLSADVFANADVVRGEDPPRIDQMISQSYALAGKIIEIVQKNEGSVTNLITQLDSVISNFNRTLVLLDKTTKSKDIARLLDNAIKISDDMVYFTSALRSKKAEESYDLIHKLLFRLEPLDGPAIRKFLQQEGIKAKIL
ncbi:MAG: MlaD family protein [Pseudobdellovibrionaceae bacterium]